MAQTWGLYPQSGGLARLHVPMSLHLGAFPLSRNDERAVNLSLLSWPSCPKNRSGLLPASGSAATVGSGLIVGS